MTTMSSSGARRRAAGGVSEEIPPINSVAPVVSGTVEIGETLTCSTGTWFGSPASYAYQWQRDGVDIGGETSSTYTVTAEDIGPGTAGIGTGITCDVVATNGGGSSSPASSNAVAFNDATYLPDTAIGVSTAGLTLADSGTTVDAWAATMGGVSATLTAPTSGQRPAYSASGGAGGRPLVTGDGSGDVLTGTVTKGSTWSTGELGLVGACLTALSSRMARWAANTLLFSSTTTNYFRARWSNGAVSTTSVALTTGHWSLDAASGGSQNLRQNGTVLVTGAAGASDESDGAQFAIFGDGAGATTNVALQAWYLGPQLTADQRTHLRALLTYHTGVAC